MILFLMDNCPECEKIEEWFHIEGGNEVFTCLQKRGILLISAFDKMPEDPEGLAELDLLDIFEFPTLSISSWNKVEGADNIIQALKEVRDGKPPADLNY